MIVCEKQHKNVSTEKLHNIIAMTDSTTCKQDQVASKQEVDLLMVERGAAIVDFELLVTEVLPRF